MFRLDALILDPQARLVGLAIFVGCLRGQSTVIAASLCACLVVRPTHSFPSISCMWPSNSQVAHTRWSVSARASCVCSALLSWPAPCSYLLVVESSYLPSWLGGRSHVHVRLYIADLSVRLLCMRLFAPSISFLACAWFRLCTPCMPQVHGTSYTTFDCFLAGRGSFALATEGGSGLEHRSDAEVPTHLPDPLANACYMYGRKATGGFSFRRHLRR